MKKGLVFLVLVAVLAGAGAYGANVYIQAKAREQVNANIQALRAHAQVTHGEVDVAPFGQSVTIHDMVIVREGMSPVYVDQVYVSEVGLAEGFPSSARIEARGIEVKQEEMQPGQRAFYEQLGYNGSMADYVLAFNYDEKAATLDVTSFSGDIRDMAKIDMTLSLADFDPERLDEIGQGVFPYAISSLTFDYQDQSLVKRVFEQMAAQEGVSVEEVKQELQTRLSRQAATLEEPLLVAAMDALQNFVADPQRLRVKIRPDQPVSGSDLVANVIVKPQRLASLLNLQVEANPPSR